VVSHETALTVHDLGEANPATVHLTVPPNFRARAPGVRLHRGILPETDVWEYEGFRITTPLRALLDIAAGTLDLDLLVTAVQEACERGPTTRQALLDRAEELGPHAALRIERALRIGGLL
jgi:hypothetical protein